MVCKNCYYNNEENAKFCVKCGAELKPEVISQNTSYNNEYTQNNTQSNAQNTQYNVNYGVQNNEVINYSPASAIVVLIISIFCCNSIPGIIFAILALVEGGKIKPASINGNMQVAKLSLEKYKKWTKYAWISTIIWDIVISLIWILYFVFIIGIAAISEM